MEKQIKYLLFFHFKFLLFVNVNVHYDSAQITFQNPRSKDLNLMRSSWSISNQVILYKIKSDHVQRDIKEFGLMGTMQGRLKNFGGGGLSQGWAA